jgi:4-amino-4-deoxy-L-arabinose transferase-like glycosyltransferase
MPDKKPTVLLVFILTAVFYLYTLLPSLAWGDGTKLQSEAISGESFVLAEMSPDEFSPDPYIFARVGVAAWDHPFYIVMGHLLVKTFPFADPLWLVNLISAIFGAASVALVFLLCFELTQSRFAALYASFSLAVSHTFWWHSSTPEVYTLFIFLLLVSFYFFGQWERTDKNTSLLYSAFFLGLAASTHILAFLALPALALYFLSAPRYRGFRIAHWKKILLPIVGYLAGFSLYILQFIRMSRSIPFSESMGPVVGSTFLSQLGTFSPILLGQSLLSYIFFLMVQFGPVGMVLGALGIRNVFDDKDASSRKLVSFFMIFALFGIFYRVTDQFTFFITSYIFWVMLMASGSNSALRLMPRKMHFLLPGILALLLAATPFFYTVLPGLAQMNGLNDAAIGIPNIGVGVRDGLAYYINPNKRGDTSAYDFGSRTLASLEPNSVVIAEWYTDTDEYFIFRYFTTIQNTRSDVTVVGWATQDPFHFDSQLALGLIEETFPERPVYLASLSDGFYASSTLVDLYCIVPEHDLYRLYQKGDDNLNCLGSAAVTE